MSTATITIDFNRKCLECGRKGAAPNGLCLACTTDAMEPDRTMRSETGRAVQQRWQRIRRERKE